MENNTFSKRLAKLRIAKGAKREEIAKLLNCSVSAISNYENGNRTPDFDSLILLADYFDTTTDYLLGRTEIKSNDKDLQFVCEYTGLSEDTINKFVVLKKNVLLPRNKEYIRIIPTFLAYTKDKYFDMFNEILNIFLQSNCLIDIITSCCIERILEYSLEELSNFENVDIKNLSEYKQEKIGLFYRIVENYSQQHKLNFFDAQNKVTDFIKSITKLEDFNEDEIENIIENVEYKLFPNNENILNSKNTNSEPLIFGYSVNDLESIADVIVDNNRNLEDFLRNIKQKNIFKNDEEMQIYITALKRLVNNKKDGESNGNDNQKR